MKAVNLFLIIALLFSTQVFAQKGEGAHKEMRKEMKAYKDVNIVPVLKAQRLKLESELTESEKNVISKARNEMETSKEANKDFRKEIKGTRKSGGEFSEVQKAKMKEIRAEKKATMETLKPIAQAHKEILKSLNEELEPKKELWKKDLQAIRSKHISDEEWEKMKEVRKAKMEKYRAEKDHKGKEHKSGKHGEHDGLGIHKMAKPTKFLLMNPNE